MSKRSFSIPAKLAALFAVSAVCGLHITAANASSVDANLDVSADVSANCSISTAPLAFGAYDPAITNAAAPLDGTGTVTVTCTNGAAVSITLDQGANPEALSSDDTPLRQMTDGTQFLAYSLYQDSGHLTVWGNSLTSDLGHNGDGAANDLTVYGRIPAGQNVAAGSFTDTVLATVTF